MATRDGQNLISPRLHKIDHNFPKSSSRWHRETVAYLSHDRSLHGGGRVVRGRQLSSLFDSVLHARKFRIWRNRRDYA